MTPFDRNEAIERFIGKCLGMGAYEFCSDPYYASAAVRIAWEKFGVLASVENRLNPLEKSERTAQALSALDWPAFAADAEFQGLLEYMKETLK